MEGEKKIFVKFVGRAPKMLQPGAKLFFYESRSKKEIVGEARITELSYGTVGEVVEKYANDLFLTRKELEEYAGDRRGKRMLVLRLSNARKYSLPLRMDKPVTMAGQYMTKRMYNGLRAHLQ